MKIKSELKEFIYPPKTVTKSCHASTVLPLSDGSVVASWFGGSAEGRTGKNFGANSSGASGTAR